MMPSLWMRLFARRAAPPRRASRDVRGPTKEPVDAPTIAGDTPPAAPAAALELPLTTLREHFFRFLLGLDQAAADLRPSSLELATLRRLEALTERFDVGGLPRLPSVLPQLLRLLKSDAAGGAQIARLIGRDPVLVGEVMRVTGSAYYRTAQPINSLQHAVVLLGQDGLRRVTTQHVMKPILQASAGMRGHMAGPYLWEHAERCAHACNQLGRQTGCDGFEAYLAGMACHAGVGAVVRLLDQEAPPSLTAFSSLFLGQCVRLGVKLSLRAVMHWELPAAVIQAVEDYLAAEEQPRSPLGNALWCASPLAMAQLLREHGVLDALPDYGEAWPERFTPVLVRRCQHDLRRTFDDGGPPA